MLLSNRQETILYTLEKLKFADRKHLQKIHKLGSDRNALRVINTLKDYLHVRTHNGRNIYYLNAKGREIVGLEKEVTWSLQVDHHLMRNDIYVYFGCPKDWENEIAMDFMAKEGLSFKKKTIIPDSVFTINGRYNFLEVDRTQSMVNNKKKIKLYSQLKHNFEQQFKHSPTLIFYTHSLVRKEKLAEWCKEEGIEFHIYTKEDII